MPHHKHAWWVAGTSLAGERNRNRAEDERSTEEGACDAQLTDDIYVVAAPAGPPEPPFPPTTAKAARTAASRAYPRSDTAATTTASTLVEHNAWIRVYNLVSRETCPSLCHLQHDPRGLARLLLCGAYRDRHRAPGWMVGPHRLYRSIANLSLEKRLKPGPKPRTSRRACGSTAHFYA